MRGAAGNGGPYRDTWNSIRYTYSEREKRSKVFVRLDRNNYRNLCAQMLGLAVRPTYRSAAMLEEELSRLHWQPYEPVRRQLLIIVKAVNRRRRYAEFSAINPSCLPAEDEADRLRLC